MSQAHAEKYYEIASKDPALLESLGAGAQSADEFIARAVAAAKQQGLSFTAEEARLYLSGQADQQADGELSDQQLEAVAGGKKNPFKFLCGSGKNDKQIAKGFGALGGSFT